MVSIFFHLRRLPHSHSRRTSGRIRSTPSENSRNHVTPATSTDASDSDVQHGRIGRIDAETRRPPGSHLRHHQRRLQCRVGLHEKSEWERARLRGRLDPDNIRAPTPRGQRVLQGQQQQRSLRSSRLRHSGGIGSRFELEADSLRRIGHNQRNRGLNKPETGSDSVPRKVTHFSQETKVKVTSE